MGSFSGNREYERYKDLVNTGGFYLDFTLFLHKADCDRDKSMIISNHIIENMLEYRAYRNGEGSRVVSSDIMGRPSDVKRFEKLAKLRM